MATPQEIWDYLLEGDLSAGELLRGVARTHLARVDVNETTGEVTIYKLDGTTIFATFDTTVTGDRIPLTADYTPVPPTGGIGVGFWSIGSTFVVS